MAELPVEFPLLLLQIVVLFISAKGLGEIFERLKIPGVIGEIIAGIIIANTIIYTWLQLDNITSKIVIEVFKELGVIFLIFLIGMETPFTELRKVGMTSLIVALLGVIIPFILGFTIIYIMSSNVAISGLFYVALFMGAALVATSVGITARILHDLDYLNTTEARVILGAAVFDDILGIIVLTLVSGLSKGTSGDIWQIVIVLVIPIIFVVIWMVWGEKIVRYFSREKVVRYQISPGIYIVSRRDIFSKFRMKDAPLVIAIMLCIALSWLAMELRLAAIIGAFLAGMAFAEVKKKYGLEEKMESINAFLVPFFFVGVGLAVSLNVFTAGIIIWAIIITILAIIGKVCGCALGSYKLGKKSAIAVGVGMVPRGEVGIIVASTGLSMGIIGQDMFAIVVFMSIATTLFVPLILPRVFRHIKKGERESAEFLKYI